MASGKRRIIVHGRSKGSGLFRRIFSRWPALELVRKAPASVADPAADSGIDFRLRRRAAIRAAREFTEQIATYHLHSRSCVHVASDYLVPADRGLQEKAPEWIAERIRFGIIRGGGECDYIRVNRVDIAWDDEGTVLFLHLAERVDPGTRAFVAAYLGGAELRATSGAPGLLLGES